MTDEIKDIVAIGDVHGNITNMKTLFYNLEKKLGPERLDTAALVFLGDYCDRGESPRKALDFLVDLKTKRKGPTRFLCGNHDLGFATFLGLIPDVYVDKQESYTGSGILYPDENMYLQGRRWGGKDTDHATDSLYNAASTFTSYGVPFGDRGKLIEAVPEAHKEFLKELEFVVDLNMSGSRYVFVHAGLLSHQPMEGQIASLKRREINCSRIPQLSCRTEVIEAPSDCPQNTTIISGHHGFVDITQQRIIVDESGGHPFLPLAAIVLPERKIVDSSLP